MSDNLRDQVRNLDLYSSDDVAMIGRARGFGVNAASWAVIVATAPTANERRDATATLARFVTDYLDATRSVLRPDLVARVGHEIDPLMKTILDFGRDLEALDPAGDYAALNRQQAVALVRRSQDQMLPAVYRVIMLIERHERGEMEARAKAMRDKADALDRILDEMDRIVRMVRMISLNAGIEAARIPEVHGRSFKLIAEEIRALAERSATLINNTRDHVRQTRDPQTQSAAAR